MPPLILVRVGRPLVVKAVVAMQIAVARRGFDEQAAGRFGW